MRATVAATLAALAALPAATPATAGCADEAQAQFSALTRFSDMKAINGCASPAGRAAFNAHVAQLDALRVRDARLADVCPGSDARWIYARNMLQTLTNTFRIAAKGCGPIK